MKFNLQAKITCLLLGYLLRFAPQAAAQTMIINASPSGRPGEAISLQGHFGADAKVYLSYGSSSTAVAPAVLVQSAGQVTVAVPANIALDLYQVWVTEGTNRSPAVFVNRAWGMHCSSPDIAPGGSVRIFGRNLLVAGASPRVRFVQQDNGSSTEATVVSTGSDAYKLVVRVPASVVPGKSYAVFVTNGLGGDAGETKVEQPLQAISAATNYFNLPVDWGHRFDYYQNVYNVKTDSRLTLKAVGNGIADDKQAIQQCINKAAQAGGGVVYLPAGTYKILASGWGGLEMASRVMLVGAGKDQTILRYGYAGTGTGSGIRIHEKTTTFGLADLTIENISDAATWDTNLAGQEFSEFVMQRVRYKLNRGRWLEMVDSDKVCITNCDITQGLTNTTGYRGPIRLDGTKNIVFANNTVTFAVDGLHFGFTPRGGGAHNIVFENNLIQRDANHRWPVAANVINHVVSFNFTHNVANLNNTYQVINGDEQRSNDGETIIAEQGAGYTPDESIGTVTGATATTLTDNSKSWGNLVQAGEVGVGIVHGKGMGQWRPIKSRTGNTLTLSSAWDVVPDGTSRYAIYTWGARNWLVQGNKMTGNQRGITLYHNATKDVMIADNVLTNNGSIDLTPLQKVTGDAQTTLGLYPMYNIQIINNSVADLNGKMGVFIGVHPVQHVQPKTYGTSVIGLEVRNNTVTAHTPNTVARVDDNFPNGYLNYLEYHTMGNGYTDEGIPAVLGSIFQSNTAANCNNALYVNSGSYNTLVCDLKLINATSGIQDSKLMGTTRASVRTVTTCADSPAAPGPPLPVADPKVNSPIPRNSGTTSLLPLTGSSPNGKVTGFAISTLPAPAEGKLYLQGQPVTRDAHVRVDQADKLSFEPNTNYMGNAKFSYTSIDNVGLVSAAASFVVPVVTPLPVELADFTVEANKLDAQLTWVTVMETNSDHFVVERSADGQQFVPLGQIRSQGNSTTRTTYRFTDVGVGRQLQGKVYYRLKQVDTDAASQFSPVRTLVLTASGEVATITTYPNPVTDQVHVLLPTAGASFRVYSVAGALLLQAATDTKQATLNVLSLPAGVYALYIQTDDGHSEQQRFIKQ